MKLISFAGKTIRCWKDLIENFRTMLPFAMFPFLRLLSLSRTSRQQLSVKNNSFQPHVRLSLHPSTIFFLVIDFK